MLRAETQMRFTGLALVVLVNAQRAYVSDIGTRISRPISVAAH